MTDIVQRGLCVAFDDAMLEPTPTWTSLYDYEWSGGKRALRIQSVDIDRGRSGELTATGTGTITITAIDFQGILDPTNLGGPFAGKIETLKQAAFFLTNPHTGDEKSLFRGLIADIETELDPSMRYMTHTITIVDFMDVIANAEVIPDSTGNAQYVATDVQTRILAALADANMPSALVAINSGNVNVQAKVYSAGDSQLSVVQDAVNAEFPGLANFFADKDGPLNFKGRYARFHPDDADYNISHWFAGDGSAVDGDTIGHTVPISALKWRRSKDDIYNSVLAYPYGIADADIPGQIVTDSTSVTDRGVRSLTFDDLLTGDDNPDGNDANDETKLIGTYYKDNYAGPSTRVYELGFSTRRAGSKNFNAWWAFVCGVDISDYISLLTTHPGGGGFDGDHFVEGLHYQIKPRRTEFPQLDLQLDLSDRALFTTDPFAG